MSDAAIANLKWRDKAGIINGTAETKSQFTFFIAFASSTHNEEFCRCSCHFSSLFAFSAMSAQPRHLPLPSSRLRDLGRWILLPSVENCKLLHGSKRWELLKKPIHSCEPRDSNYQPSTRNRTHRSLKSFAANGSTVASRNFAVASIVRNNAGRRLNCIAVQVSSALNEIPKD